MKNKKLERAFKLECLIFYIIFVVIVPAIVMTAVWYETKEVKNNLLETRCVANIATSTYDGYIYTNIICDHIDKEKED